MSSPKEVKIRPGDELFDRWNNYVWAEEQRRKTRRLGNSMLTAMLEQFLQRAESGAKPSEHPPPPNVISDTLSGLSEEDQKAVQDIAQMFRDGSAIGEVIRAGVHAWRESKGIQGEKKARRRA